MSNKEAYLMLSGKMQLPKECEESLPDMCMMNEKEAPKAYG